MLVFKGSPFLTEMSRHSRRRSCFSFITRNFILTNKRCFLPQFQILKKMTAKDIKRQDVIHGKTE